MNESETWTEVTKDEFYGTVGQLNVHPQPIGKWPSTSLFNTPQGTIMGKVVDFLPEGSALPQSRYLLPKGK